MWNAMAIPFALAGAFLVYRGFQGVEVHEAGDPTALGDFISNPAEALVDAAVDKADDLRTERRKAAVAARSAAVDESLSGFDADAALARYMANRPEVGSVGAETTAAAVRSFGRKGL
jgi:hypothetical protein